jgi:hypothetical protein
MLSSGTYTSINEPLYGQSKSQRLLLISVPWFIYAILQTCTRIFGKPRETRQSGIMDLFKRNRLET